MIYRNFTVDPSSCPKACLARRSPFFTKALKHRQSMYINEKELTSEPGFMGFEGLFEIGISLLNMAEIG